MERANGRICALDGSRATVQVDARVTCARCASGKGCGAVMLQGDERIVRLQIDLPRGVSPAVGETIGLSISPVYLLNAALIAYGLPLGGMVSFAGLSLWIGSEGNEWLSVLAAAAGLATGLLVGRRLMSSRRLCRRFVPEFDGMPGRQRG